MSHLSAFEVSEIAPRSRRHQASLWPREYGAYGQLLAPTIAALTFAPSLGGVCWGLMATALFLSHEPAQVLLGRRGERVRTLLGAGARRRLGLLLAFAVGAGILASGLAPSSVATLSVPLSLTLACGIGLALKQERSLSGQLLIGATLASFSLPIVRASGISTATGLAFAGAWSAVHVLGVVTARGAIYRKRDGGQLLGWATGLAVLLLGAGALLHGHHALPLSWCLAPWPFAAVTAALSLDAVAPRTPKPVGWALVAANAVALLLFASGA